ncbi:MAG: hypothetical protein COA99_03470 [Moraxellaceae bacterium]|nr:MAG: hypothetical protein COA99_03470 [Moraxellaceae bacterium]
MDGLGYTREDIEGGFDQSVEPKNFSAFVHSRYRFLSLVIGIVPLIALCVFVVLAAWVFYVNLHVVTELSQHGLSIELLLYLAVAMISVGLLVGLVKRVLLSTKSYGRYVILSRDLQPELYAFVEKIAQLAGVPNPSMIRLDAQAGLILKSKELTLFQSHRGQSELIIGLPLLYSLSVRQLAGVINHAFSGYDARACLNGYPFIASVNSWLYKISSIPIRSDIVGASSHGLKKVVWLIQHPFDLLAGKFFYLLYSLSSAISFTVSRKMDMAADLSSAQFAGSTEFRITQLKLRALVYGQKSANEALLEGLRRGELSSNYAAMVAKFADVLKSELRPKLMREMERLVTPLSRSRVVDLGRVVNVEREQIDANCFLLGNASRLLNDIDQIGRDVSIKHYQWLGISEPDVLLHDMGMQAAKKRTAEKTLAHTFCGWESCGRYIRIDGVNSHSALSTESRVKDLQNLVVKIARVQGQINALSQRSLRLSNKSVQLHVDKTLTAVQLHLNDDVQRANLSKLKEQEILWLRTLNEEGALKGHLSYYEALLSQRLSVALSLAVESNVVSEQLNANDLLVHVERLQDAFVFMHRIQESVKRLASYAQILGQLLEWRSEMGEPLQLYVDRYYHYCVVELTMIAQSLGAVSYPLVGKDDSLEVCQSGELLSIADMMGLQIEGFQQYGPSLSETQVFGISTASLAFIDDMHGELLSEVTRIALAAEAHYGIQE